MTEAYDDHVERATSIVAPAATETSSAASADGLPRRPTPRRQRRQAAIVVGVVVVVLGFLLFRGLGDATMYFRTADEALAQRADLGQKRFRLEGTVVSGSIKADGTFTDFAVESKGTTVQVHNSGQPVGLFQENIPVVLEGRFADASSNTFNSDRIMVKHSADYTAEHPERVADTSNP